MQVQYCYRKEKKEARKFSQQIASSIARDPCRGVCSNTAEHDPYFRQIDAEK